MNEVEGKPRRPWVYPVLEKCGTIADGTLAKVSTLYISEYHSGSNTYTKSS
jgi:hypothetical protein